MTLVSKEFIDLHAGFGSKKEANSGCRSNSGSFLSHVLLSSLFSVAPSRNKQDDTSRQAQAVLYIRALASLSKESVAPIVRDIARHSFRN